MDKGFKMATPTLTTCKEVQKVLFEFGYEWRLGGTKTRDDHHPYLYASRESKFITYGSTAKNFEQHHFEEIK